MDESTSDHTHPPSRQQAAVGGSRASSKATHAPSAKLWKQVNVHRTLRPLHGPPRARSLHSTSLPYCGYVGGPDGPACTVSGCLELPSRLAGSWGPSDSAMRFSSPGVLPSSGASTSQQWRQPMPMTCERNLCPTGEGRDGTGPSSRYEGRVFQPLLHCAQEKRWVTTNLGSAHLDAHAEPRLRMHPSPSSVCSIDLKTRTSMCRSFRTTGHSCGFSTRSVASSWALACGASLADIVGLRAGQPLTHSLDSIDFVWNRFPPVFSPQTGRSTEGPRFRVGLLKTAPESPTVDPVELLHPLGSWTWRSVRRQALTRWIPENR